MNAFGSGKIPDNRYKAVFRLKTLHPLKQFFRRQIPLQLSGTICLKQQALERRIVRRIVSADAGETEDRDLLRKGSGRRIRFSASRRQLRLRPYTCCRRARMAAMLARNRASLDPAVPDRAKEITKCGSGIRSGRFTGEKHRHDIPHANC